MAYLDWDPHYSVHVRSPDQDHQHLFAIVNQLHDAVQNRQGKQVLQPVLAELMAYTVRHFDREEAVMRSCAYPKLRTHIEQHHIFAAKVTQFSKQYQAGVAAVTAEVLDFLTEWLSWHILDSDRQYGQFLKDKGVV